MREHQQQRGTRAARSGRRGATRLAWALAGVGALALGSPALVGVPLISTAWADTVFLRDGRIVRGEVRERPDGRIEILHKHGALVVEKNDIARVDSETSGAARVNPFVDTVWVLDGRVLTGDVTIDETTKEIVIVNPKFGGETRIPRELVKQIVFRKGRALPGGAPAAEASPEDSEQKWRSQIDAVIQKLHAPTVDPKETAALRHELLGLGIYAAGYVKELLAATPPTDLVHPILEDVLRVSQIKAVVAASIEEHFQNICEALIDPDEKVRIKAIEQIAIFDGEKAPPLLLHLIRNDPSAKVKSICVGELSMLKRYEDLGAVLKMQEKGELRFVVALELGEAGIYAGIPVIVEALRIDGQGPQAVQIRTTAINALKKYTGQGDLGYLPESDDKDAREAAVKRWETWWAAEGKKLVNDNLRTWNRAEISDADRAKAIDRWRSGNKAIDEIEAKEKAAAGANEKLDPKQRSYSYELAAHLFKEATDLDPGLVSAHLSRALVLYEALGRFGEAESLLKLVLARYAPEDAKFPRLLATYHLGRIAELEGEFRKGEGRYQDAAHLDETFYQAFVGAGDCALEQGLAQPPGQTPAPGASPVPNATEKPAAAPSDGAALATERHSREEHILRAIATYRRALEAINKKADALKSSARDLGDASGEAESFPVGRLMQLVRSDREDLTKRAASVWFRLGRAQTARGDGKEALLAFKAAKTLDPNEPSYEQACAFWDDALRAKDAPKTEEPKTEGPKAEEPKREDVKRVAPEADSPEKKAPPSDVTPKESEKEAPK